MKLAALALPVLLIAAQADGRAGLVTRGYHALGTEPFWSLDIGKGSIVFVGQGDGTRIVTRTPAPRTTFNGRRYVTPRITIDITRTPCSDGMSERRYPDTVTVTIGRRTLRGCGGQPVIDAAFLEGSRWTILTIDGRGVRAPRPTEIRFERDRVEGNAGCNSFGGAYRIDRSGLTATRVIATRMACPGAGMTVERKFLSIIAGPARLSMAGDRLLTLTTKAGSVTLRRID